VRQIIMLWAMLLISLIILAFYIRYDYHCYQDNLQQLTITYQQHKQSLQLQHAKLNQLNLAINQVPLTESVNPIWSALPQSLPSPMVQRLEQLLDAPLPGITITQFKVDHQANLLLQGTASNVTQLQVFLNSLTNKPNFKEQFFSTIYLQRLSENESEFEFKLTAANDE